MCFLLQALIHRLYRFSASFKQCSSNLSLRNTLQDSYFSLRFIAHWCTKCAHNNHNWVEISNSFLKWQDSFQKSDKFWSIHQQPLSETASNSVTKINGSLEALHCSINSPSRSLMQFNHSDGTWLWPYWTHNLQQCFSYTSFSRSYSSKKFPNRYRQLAHLASWIAY